MDQPGKWEQVVPVEVDEEVLPVSFKDFLAYTNALRVAAEHVKAERPKHYATVIQNTEIMTRIARRIYMAFYTMSKVRKTVPFKSIKISSECPRSVLKVIFNVPKIFKKHHRKQQSDSNAIEVSRKDGDLSNPQPGPSKMATLKLPSNRIELQEQEVNKPTCAQFLNKPINSAKLGLPVTEAEFKKYCFGDEVVDQILKDLACANRVKYKKLQSDEGKRKLIFRNYYQAFYLRPDVRNEYKLRLKPCPNHIKIRILNIPASENTDVADDEPLVEEAASQIFIASPARNCKTSATGSDQIYQLRSKQIKVNKYLLRTGKRTNAEENTSQKPATAYEIEGTNKNEGKKAKVDDSQPEKNVTRRANRRNRDDDVKIHNTVKPAPKKQYLEVTGEGPSSMPCANQVSEVSPIRKPQNQSGLARLESGPHQQTRPCPTDANNIKLILQSIELPLVSCEDLPVYESKLPVTYYEFRKHIKIRELFVDIVKDIAKYDNDKYVSLLKRSNLMSSIIQSYYVEFYLNPAIRDKYKVQLISCPKNRKDRILLIPENTAALIMYRKKMEVQSSATTRAEEHNNLFIPCRQPLVATKDGNKRAQIIQGMEKEVVANIPKPSKVHIESVIELPPWTTMRLLKAKELFFEDVDKRCSLPYVLRTTHGLKQRIMRAVLQMSFEEFGVYTRIHNAAEIYQDKPTLERCYRRVIIDQQVWPVNLYIPVADLWPYLQLKGVPVTHDLNSISPKFLHWVDLSASTNFDDCVRFDYLKRTADQIDSNELLLDAREQYYNRCWLHEEWIWRTPVLNETPTLKEMELSGNVPSPEGDDECVEYPSVRKFLEQKRDTQQILDRARVNSGSTQELNLANEEKDISAPPVKQKEDFKMPDKLLFFIDDDDEIHCEPLSEKAIEIADDDTSFQNLALTLTNVDAISVSEYTAPQSMELDFCTIPEAQPLPSSLESETTISNLKLEEGVASTTLLIVGQAEVSSRRYSSTRARAKATNQPLQYHTRFRVNKKYK